MLIELFPMNKTPAQAEKLNRLAEIVSLFPNKLSSQSENLNQLLQRMFLELKPTLRRYVQEKLTGIYLEQLKYLLCVI